MEPISELERRHALEQIGGVRADLAEMRQEMELLREAIRRLQAEKEAPTKGRAGARATINRMRTAAAARRSPR